MAVSADGTIYFADGSNVRSVDPSGIIKTVIGHNNHRSSWKPLKCKEAMDIDEVQVKREKPVIC